MSTIKDVAACAGVSIATVSNYINNTKPVSPKCQEKISKAIVKLNYTPNFSAKSLRSNQYNDIGVILPNLSDSYYVQIFQGIEMAFQNSNHFLNLAFSYDIPDVERNIVHNFLKKQICGLALVTCMPDDWRFYYDRFTSQDKPLVLIDRLIHNLDTSFISFDSRTAVHRITSSFLNEGKKNIYLFSGSDSFYCENQCIKGFRQAFIENKLEFDHSKVIKTILNKEEAFRQTIKLLKTDTPDVILTTSELSAIGSIEALTLLGFNTPEDLIVTTLGEEHWNKFTHSFASISTVRPAIQTGEKAARLLLDQIKSPKTFEKQHILLKDKSATSPDINTKRVHSLEKPKQKSEINILMLETPQVNAIQGLLPHFENTTGIRANVEILPHRYLFDRIISEFEHPDTSKQSDVYMFDIPWLYYLASSGILADITEYINDTSFDTGVYLPNCLKYFSEFEHKYYGLPFMYAPQIFYYRKDLFENQLLAKEYQKTYNSKLRPPITWTEFNAIAEFFTNCTSKSNLVKYGTSIPTAYKECMVPELYMRIWAYGGNIFDRRHNVTFDTPQVLKAYVNYKSSFKYAKPDYKTATDISVLSDFINSDTAMLITYPSFLSDIMDVRSSSLVGSLGYNHIPGRSPILGGWSFGINANSTKKDNAFQFLNWTATEKNANYFTLLGCQPAISSIFTNDELVNLYPWLPLYHSAYQYAEPILPPYKKGNFIISQNKIDSIVFKWATELIDDNLDVAETIQHTQEDLAQLFKEHGY